MGKRLETLKSNSAEIRAIAARHKATSIAVFGSVARGEDRADSDIDFLVTFEESVSIRDWLLLNEELGAFLKTSVDVVSSRGLKPRDTHIREEAILL